MSTREIEEHIRDIYSIEVSPQFVSRATEQVQIQITEWQNRPLERIYPVVFVDGLRVSIRGDKGVLKKCVYTVLGATAAAAGLELATPPLREVSLRSPSLRSGAANSIMRESRLSFKSPTMMSHLSTP